MPVLRTLGYGDYGVAMAGFPTLVRAIPTCVGTTRRLPVVVASCRAIPTCVGTTFWASAFLTGLTGHPHVCGDYHDEAHVAEGVGGPSPRVWGLREWRLVRHSLHRAIPTCVGTTLRNQLNL